MSEETKDCPSTFKDSPSPFKDSPCGPSTVKDSPSSFKDLPSSARMTLDDENQIIEKVEQLVVLYRNDHPQEIADAIRSYDENYFK